MKSDQFVQGDFYQIETISHILTAQFNGEHVGQFQFVLVDEDQENIGVVLEFTEEELAYALIVPANFSATA